MEVIFDTSTNTSVPKFIEKSMEDGSSEIVEEKDQLKIRKLYAGLPIFDTATGLTGFDGQLFLINTGSSRRICAYIKGVLYCSTLT